MKITFNIDYLTSWGEELCIVGNTEALGGGDSRRALAMTPNDGATSWHAEIEVPLTAEPLVYGYFVRRYGSEPSEILRGEWGRSHRLDINPTAVAYVVYDRWMDMPSDKPMYSTAFVDCINRRPDRGDAVVSPLRPGHLRVEVEAPTVRPDEVLAICGDSEQTGAWNPTLAVPMSDAGYPRWSADIPLDAVGRELQYKFVILDAATRELRAWENGPNRVASICGVGSDSTVVYAGLRVADPRPGWRGAGVAIPVFSVRTHDDFGCGDFFDLMKMVDWAVVTGQKFLQILPINDTTMTHSWTDSYPYNANSTFALHPMYLRISELGALDDPRRQAYFDDLAQELNALPTVDYERVNNAKNEFTRAIFGQRQGRETLASDDFRRFVADNAEWLRPYAAFCVLRDTYNTPDFSRWGEYAVYSPEKIDSLVEERADDINYVYYIQYHLDRQMRMVHDYARSRGVAFKGDIPIGISHDSVDAWISPRLFNMDCQAGAPPDDFSVLGQNWGFPTYNWEEMARDGFAWWKARFRKMAEYFDAYRIDHVLGFFRIWQIPMDAIHGLLGIFNPALPFSPEELRLRYGFYIDPERHTRPYIMDYMLGDLFGGAAECVRESFLEPCGDGGRYRLREEFNTQRKISAHFSHDEEPSEENSRICEALMGLVDEVLFIEDPYQPGHYHPRISAQHTYAYRALSDHEKWCFNNLYDDFFYRRHNDFWYGKAMWKLPPLLDATSMLTCAEDLGMIPDCVPAVMHQLQMLSLEIQRMPKDPQAAFGDTWRYPYLSVCTTSTHDMGGIRSWWEESRSTAQRYYNEVLGQGGEAPYKADSWICDRIVTLNLHSPSMLAIFPLADWLSISPDLRRDDPAEETINVPANPRHYWRYRMHLTVEELIGAEAFNASVRQRIAASGR